MSNNRVISMFYELKDANTNDVLESNFEGEALTFLSGQQQILQKLEDAIIDLKDGETTTVNIKSGEGIEPYNEEAVQSLPKEQFTGIDLVVGMELFGESEDGQTTRVIVKEIKNNEVVVDFNHPYAGKELDFNIKILENRAATDDEVLRGMPEGKGSSCGCGDSHEHGHHHEEGHKCCGGHGHGHEEGHEHGHHHEEGHKCCGGHGHGHEEGHECCGGHGHDHEDKK